MSSAYFHAPRRFLGLIATLSLVLLFGLYITYQARELIRGPVVVIHSPLAGELLESRDIVISGHAYNITTLTLNDRPIFIDEANTFEERLVVPSGYTILTVAGEDRFGRTKEVSVEIIVAQKDKATSTNLSLNE